MKITFLGTSHGVPSADRYCSSALLAQGDSLYLLDAGAPVMDLLLRRGVDLEKIRALFTTHLHGDHVNGVLEFADLCNWYFRKTDVDIFLTEEKGIRLFRELIEATTGRAMDAERVRFRLVGAGLVYEDAFLRATAFPTLHLAGEKRPAYSYLVEGGGKRVWFSGDLSVHLNGGDFPLCSAGERIDLLICEMAHFDVAQAAPYLEKCEAKRVLFNHVAPVSKLDAIRALDGRWGYPIGTVDDGDEIEV